MQLGGKDVFLDPGTKFSPYGIMDWRYTAVSGLRQSAQGADIAETPAPAYNQAMTIRVANAAVDDHGLLSGSVGLTFKGLQAMYRRQEAGKTDAEGRKKLLEDHLREILPGDSEISLVNSPDWEATETPLFAQFRIRCPFAVPAGKRLMLAQHLFQVSEKPRFSTAQRNSAVYFHYPWQEIDEVHIAIPPGMELESLAPNDSLKLDYALYRADQKLEAPGKIFSRRDFIMGAGVFTPDKYKELKGFFDKVKADDEQPALVRLSSNVAKTN